MAPVDPRRAARTRRRMIAGAIATITISATAIAFDPDERRLIVQLTFTVLGLLAVSAATGRLRRAAPIAPRSALDGPRRALSAPAAPLPLDLVRMARRLAAAEASAADARRHLGPVVATVAADRVRERAHTVIEPDAVFSRLPTPVAPELALVLDPALEALDTRALPGLDGNGTAALVRALEQL